MKPKKQIVQCLQCDQIKAEDGLWHNPDKETLQGDISHTYCPNCIGVLQDRLLAARHFNNWDFDRQIDFLKGDIVRHEQKFDRISFKNYLEEFFCIKSGDFEKYYDILQEYLAHAVCPSCHLEIDPSQEAGEFGGQLLHMRCHREIENKVKIILDNNWDKSDKFPAYLDLLKIEKGLRPALKAALKKKAADEVLKA